MDNGKYLEDLKEIRSMMSKSTQFISLSGITGVVIGVYALIASVLAYFIIENHNSHFITLESTTFKKLIVLAVMTLFISVSTGLLLTIRKAKQKQLSLFSKPALQLLYNFLIPLSVGGALSILLIRHGYYGLLGPITLIFYGLACFNASKYTFRDIQHLGLILIGLGLFSIEFPGNSLYFWAVGFGLCHIIYGLLMHFKYDKKS